MSALPGGVTLRLHGLEQAAEDARARVQSCLTLIERLEIDELNAQRRKQFAESNKDAESVAVEDAALAKIRSALDAAGADRMLRQDAQHASAHVYAKVKSWLEQVGPDRVLEPVAGGGPQPPRGGSASG